MERDDFNDIVGPEKARSKKYKAERMSQNTTKNNQGSVERYPLGNLDKMLDDQVEAVPALRDNSEPDNDRFHQLYDNADSSHYNMYGQGEEEEEEKQINYDLRNAGIEESKHDMRSGDEGLLSGPEMSHRVD